MVYINNSAATFVLLSSLVLKANAKIACFNLGYGPQGECNSDSNSPAFLETYLVQDHLNASCAGGGTFTAVANFLGVDGIATTVTAIQTQQVALSYTGLIPFSFNQPISAIGTQNPVTVTVQATNTLLGGQVSRAVTFSQRHIPTIVTSQPKATVTSTSVATETSTSTVTQTISTIIYSRPPGATTVTKSRTSTVIAATPVTTTTLFVTPRPYTATSTTIVLLTSTLPCIPVKASNGGTFSVPWCSTPTSSVSTLPTSTTSIVVSTTVTATVLSTSTVGITTTLIAPSPTKYISVSATVTSTPTPRISKVWRVAARPTSLTNKFTQSTKTVAPVGPKATKCALVIGDLPANQGPDRIF